ncbi:MAG TPA: DUF4397 domain-containing protein [Gemmatimonadaceae bacterium]|nr:DUF4397 domain-containing protein [Gemmatimonadaceae bacterium]
MRLVNLITDATRGRVNASLEGLPFAVDLQYGQTSPATLPAPSTAFYAAVLAGNRAFVLKRTADTTVTVATLNFTIADGEDRTVYAVGGAGGTAITGFVTTDQNPAAAANQVRVRVVNMSPSRGPLDVFLTIPPSPTPSDLVTATPTFANLGYQNASAYITLPAGAAQFRAVPAGTSPANRPANLLINTGGTNVGGTGRTFVVIDNDLGGAPLRLIVLSDR